MIQVIYSLGDLKTPAHWAALGASVHIFFWWILAKTAHFCFVLHYFAQICNQTIKPSPTFQNIYRKKPENGQTMGQKWHKMAQGPKVTQKKVPKVPDFFKKKDIFSSKYFRFFHFWTPCPPLSK